jgi:hypothetical protein
MNWVSLLKIGRWNQGNFDSIPGKVFSEICLLKPRTEETESDGEQ